MANHRPTTQIFEPDNFRIEYPDTFDPLSQEAEKLLQTMFANHGRLQIVQKLGGGFTQSRVFVVQPWHSDGTPDLPLVLKIGPTWLIEQEERGYQRYIRDKLAGRIELVEVALTDTLGGLGYRLAGDGQFKHESLTQFCHRTDRAIITKLLTGRLFKRLSTLWQSTPAASTPYSAAKYDLLLPVHLVIAPGAAPPDMLPQLITPAQLSSEHLIQGDWVRIEGFVVTEIEADDSQVTLDLPQEKETHRSHRLRLQPVSDLTHFPVNQETPPVEGRVVQTRYDRLQREVDAILSPDFAVDVTPETLYLPQGRSLPNPLPHLSSLLTDWPAIKTTYLHGDCHLENILVDPETRDVTLIDFANAGTEHVLHDLLHLEMSVVTNLLAGALVEAGETPELICTLFYGRLHQAATTDSTLFKPPPLLQPALQKIYGVLAAIRQTAQGYLTTADDWTEYYQGLALYLVGALKFKDLAELESAPYPKQLALLGASMAVELWQRPAEQPVPIGMEADLRQALQKTLSGVIADDLNRDPLALSDGTYLPNPLVRLADLLDPWLGSHLTAIHGHFNLDELLSNKISQSNLDKVGQQIDYLVHDLLLLEIGLVSRLPQALAETDHPLDTIRFLLYERLHRAIVGGHTPFEPPKALPPALHEACNYLAAIRKKAAHHLTTIEVWRDYYRGLTLYLLGLIQLKAVSQHPDAAIIQEMAFLVAALMVDLWDQPHDRPHPPTPYKGLHTFQASDAAFFYGRERVVEQLVGKVQQSPVMVVTGPSGSGKSSLVRAGLGPRLVRQSDWEIISFRPGSAPFQELTQALIPFLALPNDELVIRRIAIALQEGTISPAALTIQLLERQPDNRHLLLIADQFEELYTLCPDSDTCTQFIDTLLALTNKQAIAQSQQSPDDARSDLQPPTSRLHLLLTLRADFMGKALAHRPLADALQTAPVELIGAMTRSELERAIERPAEKLGISFEVGLVERILDDAGDEPGRLPLLEFALTLLWQLQAGGRITWAAYESIGRVEGAITHYAERIFKTLSPAEQHQARRIFTQLVHPGAGIEDTRRVATQIELAGNWSLVQRLADSRLIVTNRSASGIDIAEVVHEALIQTWERLRQWMAADRIFRAWQERLRVALNQWQTTEYDEGGLLRGAPLVEAEEWLEQRTDDLSWPERDFILRSITLRHQQQAAAEAERRQQLAQAQALAEEQRQRAEAERLRAAEQAQAAAKLRQRAWGLGAMLILLLLAIIAALIFNQNARIFEQAAWTAGQRRATAEFLARVAEQRQATAEVAAQAAETAEAKALTAESIAVSARQEAETDRDTAFAAEQTAAAARSTAQNLQTLAEQGEANANAARQTAVADEATAQAAELLAVQAQATAQAGQATADANRSTAQARRAEAELAMQEAQQALAVADAAKQAAEAAKQAAEQAAEEAKREKRKAEEAAQEAEATRTAAENLRNEAEADLARTRQLAAIIRNTQTCPVDPDPASDSSPEALAYDGTYIWVVNKGTETANQLSAADCNKIVSSYAIGNGPSDITFDGNYIWVAERLDNTVRKIDPVSGQASVFTVGPAGADRPTALLFEGSNLWVALTNFDTDQNEVRSLDPETGIVSSPYNTGRVPSDLAYDGSHLWVANREDHTVSKINTTTGQSQVFSVGSNPSSIIYDGAYMWVANEISDDIMKLQVSNGAIINTFKLGDGPAALAFDGHNIWSANKDISSITGLTVDGTRVIDIPTAREPEDILFDGTNLWVVAEIGNVVQKIPISIRPVGRGPAALTFQNDFIWVANSQDNTLSKVAILNNNPAQMIRLNHKPTGLVSAGTNIWVSHGDDNMVSKIRGQDGAILGVFQTGGVKPGALTFDGTYIWVTQEESHSVARLRESNGNETVTFPVGRRPVDILFDGSNIWVANYDDQSVLKLSLDGTTLTTYSLNGAPTSLAYDGSHVWVGYLDFNQLKVRLGKLHNSNGSLEANTIIDIGFSPPNIIFDGRYIWLASQSGSNNVFETMVRIDPANFTDQQVFRACSEPSDLLRVEQAVWITCQADDFIQKISDNGGHLPHATGTKAIVPVPEGAIALYFPVITKNH